MREGTSGGHLDALVKCKGRNTGDRGVSEEEACTGCCTSPLWLDLGERWHQAHGTSEPEQPALWSPPLLTGREWGVGHREGSMALYVVGAVLGLYLMC